MGLVKGFSIRTKLNVLVLFASLLMVFIGLTGLWGINISTSALSSVYSENLIHIIQLNEVRDNQNRIYHPLGK